MKTQQKYKGILAAAGVLLIACACPAANGPAANPDPGPAILTAMQDELGRSVKALSQADPSTYFISYTVADRQYSSVSGSNGALLSSSDDRGRWLEVQK